MHFHSGNDADDFVMYRSITDFFERYASAATEMDAFSVLHASAT
jgi:hypothetical protein